LKRRFLPVPPAVLLDIEQSLAEPAFAGIPLGSTLRNFLVSYLSAGKGKFGIEGVLTSQLRRMLHVMRPSARGAFTSTISGATLMTWVSPTARLRDMVLPLLSALGPANCVVMGQQPSMRAQLPAEAGFIAWGAMPDRNRRDWHAEYSRCAPAWHQSLRQVIRRHGLPHGVFAWLADVLVFQSRQVLACLDLVDRLQPSVVVTEYDRNPFGACLVLSARTRGVPTVTMMHGVVGTSSYEFTPLLADLALCWGELQRQQMMSFGVPEDRLVITGCQRLTRTLTLEPTAARGKVGLPPERPVVLLASANINRESPHFVAQAFCEAFSGRRGLSAVVRLHPSESLAYYSSEIRRFPDIRFLPNDAWTVGEALAASDVIVCRDSGLGNDALVKKRLVVVLDNLPEELGNGRSLAEHARAPVVHDASQLRFVVEKILSDERFRTELEGAAERYVPLFCSAFGDEAAHNAAEAVRRVARTRSIRCSAFANSGECLPVDEGTVDRQRKALIISSSATPSGKGTGTVMYNLLQRFGRREMAIVSGYWLCGPRFTWSSQWPRRFHGMLRLPSGWRGDRWLRLLQWPFLLASSLLLTVTGKYPVVLVVYPNDGFLLAGYLVSILARRPLLPYFHNTYLDANQRRLTRWLQPRVFARAGQVVVISEGMKRRFAARYPRLPCHVLTHSHNVDVPDPEKFTNPPIHTPVRLAMLGNINASNLDAAVRVLQAVGTKPGFALTAFTTQPAHQFTRLGLDPSLMHIKGVPYESLISQIMEHDILIHPHGITGGVCDVEQRTIFPTRTIEYLLSCRPIVAHVPADSYIGEFYRQHECALVVSQPDPSAIRSALDLLLNDGVLRSTLVKNALRAAQMFHADRVSLVLRALIRNASHGADEVKEGGRQT
jgi:glycosyltransferase involved in cell wall biosynthesis